MMLVLLCLRDKLNQFTFEIVSLHPPLSAPGRAPKQRHRR